MFLLKRLRLWEQRRQSLQKFAQKAPQPPALKPPSTARTAGRSDWAGRRFRRQPFILLSFSSSEKPQKRRKRSHTNVSNTLVARPSTPPAQTPQRTFRGTAAGPHLPSPTGSHTAAHRAKHGVFRVGVVSLPSERFARFGNPARPGVRTANFAAFRPWSGVLPENAESLRNSDALMRVAVPRRRGPAGLRDPVAVSLAAVRGFTVLSVHDNSTQGKILAGFTRWSAPCVLPLAAVPLPCPQHPSAADKTGRWKTGSAGSCREDFRFACARPA